MPILRRYNFCPGFASFITFFGEFFGDILGAVPTATLLTLNSVSLPVQSTYTHNLVLPQRYFRKVRNIFKWGTLESVLNRGPVNIR